MATFLRGHCTIHCPDLVLTWGKDSGVPGLAFGGLDSAILAYWGMGSHRPVSGKRTSLGRCHFHEYFAMLKRVVGCGVG